MAMATTKKDYRHATRKRLQKNIKAHLERLDWFQADLARAAGWSQMRVSHLMHGRHCPNVAAVAKIAAALGTTVDELIR